METLQEEDGQVHMRFSYFFSCYCFSAGTLNMVDKHSSTDLYSSLSLAGLKAKIKKINIIIIYQRCMCIYLYGFSETGLYS